jgi:hypothetical protein
MHVTAPGRPGGPRLLVVADQVFDARAGGGEAAAHLPNNVETPHLRGF